MDQYSSASVNTVTLKQYASTQQEKIPVQENSISNKAMGWIILIFFQYVAYNISYKAKVRFCFFILLLQLYSNLQVSYAKKDHKYTIFLTFEI